MTNCEGIILRLPERQAVAYAHHDSDCYNTETAFMDVTRRVGGPLADVVMALIGFVFCLWIWLGLKTPAKIIGGAWFVAGLIYRAIRTRGFRERPIMIDFSES